MGKNNIIFGVQLFLSAVLYLVTVGLNAALLYIFNQQREEKQWFLPCLAIQLLSSVILQLVSAVLLLIDKGDNLSTKSTAWIAVLHIFQLGFIWRHSTLFRNVDLTNFSREYHHLHYLGLLYTFVTLLPLGLIQLFVILHAEFLHWLVILTFALNILVSCWYLAAFRYRRSKYANDGRDCEGLSTLINFVWRLGEISARLVSLTVFATVYYYWIFLIISLHGLTMLVCICTTILGTTEKSETSKTSKVLIGLIMAYIYSFCFINFSSDKPAFRHTFYYVIMFLENSALAIVWYLHTKGNYTLFHKNAILIFIACAFCIGIIFLLLSIKYFETKSATDPERQRIYASEGCINCKLSMCSKHCIKMQRPFSAGYMSQYQKALANGQYFKNILQDKFLDTDGASSAELFNSSGEHWQIRDTDVESIKVGDVKQYTSVQAVGTYTHKRFFDSNSSIGKGNDTDSISSEKGSGMYEEDWRKKSDITLLSATDALSLVSSRTQLLTDSWDNLIHQDNNITDDHKHAMKIEILNSLIRKDLDTSYFSDEYTTDHTLDSYQLPVTVLAKKRSIDKRKAEPAYSTASDSTDCTICAFMRQHPSSPEESRRNFKIYDDIPEETQSEPTERKRHVYKFSKGANKQKRSKPQITNDSDDLRRYRPYRSNESDDLSRHRYEKYSSRQRRRDMIRVLDHKPNTKDNVRSNTKQRQTSDISSDSRIFPLKNPEVKFQSMTRHRPDNETSGSFTDSEDSAFPRHTPVCDRNVSKADPVENKDVLYAKPYKTVPAVNSAKIADSRKTRVSESVDSVSFRKTSLSEYLLVLDNNKDGTSESSCEMII